MAESTVHTFEDITTRLDEIIATVRSKDLDLFDEAIKLGSKAVELVDSFDMSPTEAAMLEEAQDSPVDADSDAAAEASDNSAEGAGA